MILSPDNNNLHHHRLKSKVKKNGKSKQCWIQVKDATDLNTLYDILGMMNHHSNLCKTLSIHQT